MLIVMVFLGVFLVLLSGGKSNNSVNNEKLILTGSNDSIRVVPIQIGRDSYGLAMIDVERETLWIYEINPRGTIHNRLKLLAARSWKYDRFLQDYNTSEPRPEQVRLLLEELGQLPKEQEPTEDIIEMAEPNQKDF